MDWKVTVITYNVAMGGASTATVRELLAEHLDEHMLAIGLQEVAHAETMGGGGSADTWAHTIRECVGARMVLVAKNWQATNQLLLFARKSLVGQIKRVDWRFERNTMGGLTGHKGSIGARIQLNGSPYSLVFVDSHFVHGAEHYRRRVEQYHTNRNCSFPEDKSVRATFWFGDFNFRVDETMDVVLAKIAAGTHLELLESREQLRRALDERDAFHGFHESPIRFEPTYRVTMGSAEHDGKRVPSWTDRVLFKGDGVRALAYSSNPRALGSDHLPVVAKFRVTAPVEPSARWQVVFEHLPTWYASVPLVGRFQIDPLFYKQNGSYRDWIGVFPATIDDCTSSPHWIYAATCFEQQIDADKFRVCEFSDVPPGNYRLGYFSIHLNCLVGLSKSFQIVEQP